MCDNEMLDDMLLNPDLYDIEEDEELIGEDDVDEDEFD
jgi:hypothetical protein